MVLANKHRRINPKSAAEEAVVREELKKWRQDINYLFSQEQGKRFLRRLFQMSNVYVSNLTTEPSSLLVNEARKSIYLELIRPFLDKETLISVEYESDDKEGKL